jgi:very-short-patch-repair endonuclease
MIHGLPYFGEDGLVHLVRTDGQRGRRDGTIWVHSPIDPRLVVEVDGIRTVTPATAALQVAATHGPEAGLVALDGVLRQAELQDLEDVGRRDGPAVKIVRREAAALLGTGLGQGTPSAVLVAGLADGRSESAGESRSRWLVRVLGLGPCTPQFPVLDGEVLIGRADLKLDRWDVIIEFDGTGKYTSPDRLLAEKDREDRIRSLGYEVVRLRWADLARPHLVRQRILAAIARAEARTAPTG